MSSKITATLATTALTALFASVSHDVPGPIGRAEARTSADVPHIVTAPPRAYRPGLPLGTGFFENWDSYAAGSNVHGQGGWKGWGNNPDAGAFVSDAQSVSPDNSIDIEGPSDLIHEFSGYTSGVWVITAQQYIPSDFSGNTYFIFENVYSDTDTTVISWSTQVVFRSETGTVENYDGSANPGSLPFVTDQWVELKLVVDLDNDLQTFYYGGTELYSGSWTGQFPGQLVQGILNIASIDLYAEDSTTVYYDDISIAPASPYGAAFDADGYAESGAAGTTATYTLTLSNTGTENDTYDIAATSANGWTVTPSVPSIAIDAGASASFDVAVEIPADAAVDAFDTETVTATSEGDPEVSATATLTTTVVNDDTIFADGFDPPT
jgi:hypothetical protein